MPINHRHAIGIVRREFLQVGFSGFLGVGTAGVIGGRSARGASDAVPAPRAKSMILVFLTGAASHIDTFDPKPDAPEGIRGEFRPIATNVPGISVCEHLPRLAGMADRLAIVRSMRHDNLNHLNSTHLVLTGNVQPGFFFDKIASRDDYPCYASVLDHVQAPRAGVPTGVTLPTFLQSGPLTWPGQHAGFLGPRYDPWQIRQDPNGSAFRVEDLSLPEGFTVERLRRRLDLLGQISAGQEAIEAATAQAPLSDRRRQALSLLLTGQVARALDLSKEDPRVRDRYGRHMFGQSLLLARKLVDAGVPVVQVNMGRVQNWDTHGGNFRRLKNELLPPLDQGLASLLDDLALSGRLDETLVVVTGEFGRTPKVGAGGGNANKPDGRDHWSSVFSTVFAGGGVRGGQVVGQSDRIGAYPASRPFTPADLGATVYQSFGIDPTSTVTDRLGRPIQLSRGRPIEALFSGVEV
ncbi:MAG: DUF1501 domain-containing protein [Isosphaeraceae bacterium]